MKNLYLRLCILLAGLVYYPTVRAQVTITSIMPASMCAGSPINVSYSNTYAGQATLSLYLYSATDSLYLTQLTTSGGNGTFSTYLPNGLATKTYTVGIKLVASQTTYLSPRSNDFTINAVPPSPTGTSSFVGYCQGSSVAPLSAIASSGGTLLWYSGGGPSSTVPPTPSTATAGTFIYFVSQRVNGCEGPRTSINVSVKATPSAPTVVVSPVYCQGSPAVPLSAGASTGGTLRWYTSADGSSASTVPPTPSTATAGLFTYYVSQIVNGCESPRANVNVTVNPSPVVSITPSSATLTPAQTSLTLVATASASTLLWSSGETTASILVNTTGIYLVTATTSEGCTAVASSSISQASSNEVYSMKSGNWDDPTIWSMNQLPTSGDAVRLRHSVSLPIGYQAQAAQVRYDEGGALQMGANGFLKLGN